MTTAILIPYYNDHAFIGPLVESIHQAHPDLPILIIDDGSPLPFPDLREDFVTVHHLHENRGKGYAIKTGIRLLKAQSQIQAVLVMDADGQHAPSDIHSFLNQHQVNPDVLLIGKRQFSPNLMPLARVLSNSLSSKLLSSKLKTAIADSQCGFRLIPRSFFPIIEQCRENGFQFETEMLIRTVRSGNSMKFISIRTIYNGSNSRIKKWQDIKTFMKLFFQL